ncbi:DUF4190 domain-containing protein [Amycolatopsis mongoliensis]|uniref:DUF4190 domain-containing protein n=1 Tax=Amycolatopsis mongoliensis TaxID=715475 RepID=A0A9Y2NHL9_9PSEU|nr:DUF4190 domain-containing protein [Amycolatopsis sp. 4-36]WIY05387.1 DUF4190 domain-containing protein [Amycolatopsis sp. 4-36]
MTGSDPYPSVHPDDPASRVPVPSEPVWQQNPVSVPVPAQPYPAAYGVPMPMPMLRTSGLCVAGMVVGILALLGFWIPVGDVLMGLLAIGLSWAGLAQAAKPGFAGRGMGVAGLVCGIIAMIPAIIFMVIFFSATAAVTTCGIYC